MTGFNIYYPTYLVYITYRKPAYNNQMEFGKNLPINTYIHKKI